MVIKDVEREDVPFICKTVGCQPVADVTALSPERYVAAPPFGLVAPAVQKFLLLCNILSGL